MFRPHRPGSGQNGFRTAVLWTKFAFGCAGLTLSALPMQAQHSSPQAALGTVLSVHDDSLLANAHFGNIQAVRGALSRGAHVDARDEAGRTALMLAADYKSNESERVYAEFKHLLEVSGLAKNVSTGYGSGLVWNLNAEAELHSDPARFLLNAGAKTRLDLQTGKPLLFWSPGNGNTDILTTLLDQGANLNARDKEGNTALIYAVTDDNDAACQLLLQHGADVNTRGGAGLTALGYAALRGNVEIVQALLAHSATLDPRSADGPALLRFAIGQQNVAQVRDLLDQGVPVTNAHYDGPLFWAAHANNVTLVRLLVAHGADVNAVDQLHRTIFGEALLYRANAAMNALLELGANPNGTDVFGRTYLTVAASEGDFDLANTLLAKGADVDGKIQDGETPLHAAARSFRMGRTNMGASSSVRQEDLDANAAALSALLLDKGASVNARDSEGKTPLFVAVFFNRSSVAKVLIAHGAAVNIKDKKGDTPLVLAERYHANQIITVLKAAGAKE